MTIRLFSAAAPHALPAPLVPTPGKVDAVVQAAMDGHPRLLQRMMDGLGEMATNLVVAALIALVTVWVSGWVARLIKRAIGRLSRVNGGESILQTFVPSFVRWAILIFGLIAVLEQLGVKTTSILAMIGAASLAIGLALQGSLSNVAASVMILILRPYRIGDFVEINGKMGTVRGLDLFGTKLADPDNLEIFMPNSKVFGEMIINYSSPSNRRMELNFRLDYEDDADHALAVLKDCVAADKRILAKPESWTGITALGESAVTLTLRAWAPVGIYWEVRYAMLKRVKDRFKAEGFRVPYPRQINTDTEPRAPARKAAAKAAEAEPDAKTKTGRRKSSGNQPTSQDG